MTPTLRIALLLSGFSSDENDWCIPALLNFVRATSQHVDLEVFALRYPHRRDTYRIGNATVHSLGWAQRRGVHSLTLWTNAVSLITQRHRQKPFDVIHALWLDEPGWLGAYVAQRLHRPFTVSLIGGELVNLPMLDYGMQRQFTQRQLIAWTLRRATHVTVGTSYLMNLARAHGIAQPVVAPLGVDAKMFSPTEKIDPQGDEHHRNPVGLRSMMQLINVGSLVPVKGHALLLNALRFVVNALPQTHLNIIGEGPLQNDLAAQIQQLSLQNHMTLCGAITHDQLPAHYQASSLFVQSSWHDAQPLAMLEAAACGVPCVGTNVGFMPDFAPTAAIATPVGDEHALADAMIELLRDDKKRAAMGQAAREKVEELYSVEHCVERFMGLWSGSR